MKKYLLPLIFILLLTFTLIGNCGWLSGWDQRIELSIDDYAGDIGAEVTWFPVTVFLTTAQGEEVSTELTTDAEYLKVAFTKADGTTELYGECELFDVSEEIRNSFETGGDLPGNLGDVSDTDYWTAAKFTISSDILCSGASTYLTGQNGNPTGDLTFRIETDVGSEPSGTLAHANATGTVANGDIATSAWNKASYTPFTLSAGTYWMVSYIPDQATDVRWLIQRDDTGGTGQAAWSGDHGANWTLGTANRYLYYYRIYGRIPKGIFHVSRDGWVINANTSIYMYYDKDHADNTTYVGAINTTAGATVWDGSFVAVYHMVDATTSTVVDSTSNNSDGTKVAANEPLEVTGKVGQGQDFDGGNDYFSAADSAVFDFAAGFTLEAIADPDSIDAWLMMISRYDATSTDGYWLWQRDIGAGIWGMQITIGGTGKTIWSDASPSGAFQYIVGTRNASNLMNLYVDGAVQAVTDTNAGAIDSNSALYIGTNWNIASHFAGVMDEVRISSATRNATWIKGTYNSLFDTLLTYGSEETSAEEDNAIFFGTNF